MRMGSGKYKGDLVAQVLFDHPDYFLFLKRKGLTNSAEYIFARSLVEKFDAMPFSAVKCSGGCGNAPTYMTLYRGIYNGLPFYFCDSCSPYSHGAQSGVLSRVSTYMGAASVTGSKELLKAMLRGKGLEGRRSEAKWKSFFGY